MSSCISHIKIKSIRLGAETLDIVESTDLSSSANSTYWIAVGKMRAVLNTETIFSFK